MQTIGNWSRRVSVALPSLILAAGLSLPGCGGGGAGTSTSGGTATPPAAPEGGTSAANEAQSEEATIAAALAKLSPEDQAAAKAQKVCPVSGEPLGSMDTPITVMAGERKVFLCCGGCKKEFEDNPEKYLAKLSGGESGTAPEATPATNPEGTPESSSGESGT